MFFIGEQKLPNYRFETIFETIFIEIIEIKLRKNPIKDWEILRSEKSLKLNLFVFQKIERSLWNPIATYLTD